MHRNRFFAFLTVTAAFWLSAAAARAEGTPWVQAAFEEINAASPMVGSATMPLDLALAMVEATPSKHLRGAAEDGFDIPAIAQKVKGLPAGAAYEVKTLRYRLVLTRFDKPPQPDASPSRLYIQTSALSVPVPLMLTGAAVSILQYAVEDLQGMDDELARVLEEVKKTPPGMLLEGRDEYMDSWLKISLY